MSRVLVKDGALISGILLSIVCRFMVSLTHLVPFKSDSKVPIHKELTYHEAEQSC